jgi:heme exporter protein D
MYFDSVAAALTMDGHGAYVWSAYALSLLVLVYVVSAPLRRQRNLLRELRGEARRNADRSLRNDVELN